MQSDERGKRNPGEHAARAGNGDDRATPRYARGQANVRILMRAARPSAATTHSDCMLSIEGNALWAAGPLPLAPARAGEYGIPIEKAAWGSFPAPKAAAPAGASG